MSKKSPMSLSLDYLNKLGYNCDIVERWIQGANVRKDAFTFGDILAYHARQGIVLIQTTSSTNFAARRAKIVATPHSKGWLQAGGKIWLHAWGNRGLREEWFAWPVDVAGVIRR